MRLVTIVLASTLALASGTAQAGDSPSGCATRHDLVSSCRVVHGRLKYYNGTPSFRIWMVGTDRLLGVKEVSVGDNPEHPLMPLSLWRMVGDADFEVFGDLEVCPLSRPRKGEMQSICVESAAHLIKEPYGALTVQRGP